MTKPPEETDGELLKRLRARFRKESEKALRDPLTWRDPERATRSPEDFRQQKPVNDRVN